MFLLQRALIAIIPQWMGQVGSAHDKMATSLYRKNDHFAMMTSKKVYGNLEQKADRWRRLYAANAVLFLSLIVFLAAAISIEGTLRFPAAGVPYPVKGFDAADEMFRRLDWFIAENGDVDCIFIGSSLVYVGIQPELFEEAYFRQTGEQIECFTFGVSSATASSIGPLAHILVNRYDPDLLVWGTQARDFSGEANEPEEVFPTLPWSRYHLGDFNVTGLLEDISFAYRYFETIPDRMAGEGKETPFEANSESTAERPASVPGKAVAGFQPLLHFAPGSPLDSIKQDFEPVLRVETKPFEALADDVDGFEQFLLLGSSTDTRLLIVEMPMPTKFYVDYSQAPKPTRQQFLQTLRDRANRQGVPFWLAGASDLFPVTVFTDPLHLHASGSFAFSDWLGFQVGEMVSAGWPEDYLSMMPLDDEPALPRQDMYGLSPQKWQIFQQQRDKYNDRLSKGVIFNPRSTVNRQTLQTTAGLYIEFRDESKGEPDETYYDLMALQERMVFAEELKSSPQYEQLLTQWYSEPEVAYLKKIGVDYVLFTELWSRPDTLPEVILGAYSDGYRLVDVWDYAPMQESYYLYTISTE
jgi:hypothetical protein